MGRLWLASSIALFGAVGAGCSDGSSTSVDTDAGKDGGGTDDVDAGEPAPTDSGTPKPACEALVNADGEECPCVPLTARDTFAEPCWMEPETQTVCGVKSSQLPGGDPTKGDQCVVRDAPGTLSTYCGNFFDQIDALVRDAEGAIQYDAETGAPVYETEYTKGKDSALTFPVAGTPIVLRFEGCCLPSGECGAMLSVPRALDAREPNAEGSLYVTDFNGAPFDLHLGCTSVTELVARLAGTSVGPSLPSDKLVDLPFCQYSESGDPGKIETGELPGYPGYVCGCGDEAVTSESGFPCLQNLPADVCGAEPVDATSLSVVPQFVCGCEGAPPGSALPCLPKLAHDVCGSAEPTEEDLAAIPQFICGNVGSDPFLPEALKLPNVAATVCGTLEVASPDSPYLAGVPEFLCGAEGEPRFGSADLPKLPNLDSNLCGGLNITTGNPYLGAFPTFLCGCIDTIAPELGCLPNIESTVCGTAPVTNGSQYVAQIPKFLCGCGSRIDSGVGPVCMSNTPADVCGSLTVPVNDKGTVDNLADDCLVGVPEYAHGCGADVATPPENDPTCLKNTAALFGCDDVTSTQERLPEFLCGCGEGVLGTANGIGVGANRLPCLPGVAASICGGVDVTSRLQLAAFVPAPLSNLVCGCGNGVTSSLPCLDNVDSGVCGSEAECTGIGTTGSCTGANEICRDLTGTLDGQSGDGVGDVCVVPSNG